MNGPVIEAYDGVVRKAIGNNIKENKNVEHKIKTAHKQRSKKCV